MRAARSGARAAALYETVPHRLELHRAAGPRPQRATYRLQYANGRLDGFVSALQRRNQDGRLALGYRDARDLPFYWNLADEYVLYDRFFSSAGAGSFLNHIYWVAASPGAGYDRVPPNGFGNLPTIFDRLQQAHVSWKFYVQNYEPRLNYRTMNQFPGNRASQVIWVPILNFARYLRDPGFMRHVVGLDQYYKDLEAGKLPEVSFIAPSGPSEHPPSSLGGYVANQFADDSDAHALQVAPQRG